MASVVVDANVWISALIPAEDQHAESRAWLDGWRTAGNGIVVPITFLVELACVLSRKHNLSSLAVATLADINSDVSIRPFPIDRALAEVAADIGITVGLRGADALYAAVAKHESVPLVTWDAELLARASPGGFTALPPTN